VALNFALDMDLRLLRRCLGIAARLSPAGRASLVSYLESEMPLEGAAAAGDDDPLAAPRVVDPRQAPLALEGDGLAPQAEAEEQDDDPDNPDLLDRAPFPPGSGKKGKS